MAQRARQVTMVVRGDSLARSMSEYLIREIEVTPNLAVRLNTVVTDGHGTGHLEALTLDDVYQDRIEQVPAAGLVVQAGCGGRVEGVVHLAAGPGGRQVRHAVTSAMECSRNQSS